MPSDVNLGINDFRLISVLGRGHFGKVRGVMVNFYICLGASYE